MARCCLGLGGNIGDVAATFRTALQRLAESGEFVLAVSRVYATAPVGPDAGDPYQNACAIVESSRTPRALLDALHQLEDAAGRTRSLRWGARTLDLDVLTYDNVVTNDRDLTLPHPGIVYRRFVLDPLAEIAPELVHPVVHRTVADLQQRLRERPLPLRIFSGSEAIDLRLVAQLRERFGDSVNIEVAYERESSPDPTVLLINDVPQSPGAIGGALNRIGAVHVPLDSQLAAHDPLAAAVAALTAMLDEPRVVGSL